MKNLTEMVERAKHEADSGHYETGQLETINRNIEKVLDLIEDIAAELDAMHGTVREHAVGCFGDCAYTYKGSCRT